MWTINITPLEDSTIHVRVLRWGTIGRYPAQIGDFVCPWYKDEPELERLERCLRIASGWLAGRREELQLPAF